MPATRQPATRRPAQRCADEPRRYAWHPFDGFAARNGILSSNPIIHDQPICRNDQSRPPRSIRRSQKLRSQTDGARRFHPPAPTPVGAPLVHTLAHPPNSDCTPHQCAHPTTTLLHFGAKAPPTDNKRSLFILTFLINPANPDSDSLHPETGLQTAKWRHSFANLRH